MKITLNTRTLLLGLTTLAGLGLAALVFSHLGVFGFPGKSASWKKMAEMTDFAYSPEPGETLAYRFSLTSESVLNPEIFSAGNSKTPSTAGKNTEETKLTMKSSGDLFLKFYPPEKKGDNIRVAGAVADYEQTLNDATPVYARAVTYPFVFDMNPKGYLSGFRFTKGIPEEAKSVVRNILYSMQTAYPKGDGETWQTKEIDTTGQYQANYAFAARGKDQGFTVAKVKEKYLKTNAADNDMNPLLRASSVRIVDSRAETLVPLKGAWILKTGLKESTVMESGKKQLGKSDVIFTAEREDKQPPAAFAATFNEALSALNSQGWFKEKYKITDSVLDNQSRNLDLDQALKAFLDMRKSLASSDRRKAEAFMLNYLRLFPKAAYDLIKAMDADPKKQRFSHEDQLLLWQLIAEAGHEDAQKAVLDAVTNPSFSDLTHMRAMAYVHSFEYPEEFMLDSLWNYYGTLDKKSEKSTTKELWTMTLYAIGGLGGPEKLNDALKAGVGKSLVENLKKTKDTSEQVTFLEAIGNYGGSDVLTQIEPYFASDSENVRIASFNAIRRMDSPAAFDAFTGHYEKETSRTVKSAALKFLTGMNPSQKMMSWSGKEVLTVTEPDDQEALTKVLGENMKTWPDNEKPLRDLLAKKPSNMVKKTVYRYVAP
jgi:hypothetical protein